MTERLHFHYVQQGNLIAETNNKGKVVREYIYLGNYRIAMTARSLDKPGMSPNVLSTGANSRADVIPTGTPAGRGVEESLALYYIHNDHLGTPQKVTDTEQLIVWSMNQTPFGEVALTTEAIRMPMRFPGQYTDIESGFSYNYYRDYDPSLGRYLQSDPIGLLGGPNTFGYVVSNPIRFSDPFGLVHPSALVEGCTGLGCRMNNTPERGDIQVLIQGCAFGVCTETPFDRGDPQLSIGTTVLGGGFKFCEEPEQSRSEVCESEVLDTLELDSGVIGFEKSNVGRRCINVGVRFGPPVGGSRDIF